MRIYRIRTFPIKSFLLILFVIIVIINPKLFSTIKNFTFEILIKPLKILSKTTVYFKRTKDVREENLTLKQRVAEFSLELARMKDISLENERLRGLLDFEKSTQYKTIVAKVIGRDSIDWRSSIIINRGKKQGIREHMPCATAKGLIGSVVEVGPDSSKVMLITDPNSKIGVILESSRESGILMGSADGTCKVIYLSIDGNTDKEERVLTAGFSNFFPKGLEVGKVKDTGLEETHLYKYAIVEPSEDMNKIEEVVCIDTARK